MSDINISDVNDHYLRNAVNADFIDDLKREIKEKLRDLDVAEGSSYGKPDVIRLIISIETYKLRFLQGEISARDLYSTVAAKLDRFKIEHPGFNFLNDLVVNAYYS